MAFTINTDLSLPSPLTAEQIDKYLLERRQNALAGIGCVCIVAQAMYGINASYMVGHAALETGWGKSKIAREKNNLFGWSAFDSSPYSSAKGFPTREHCVIFVMERIHTLYLAPGGRYFSGRVLGRRGDPSYGMNKHYATDPNWGSKIARIAASMERFFGVSTEVA